MPITMRQTQFADFEALQHAMQDAPQDVVQIENGPIHGTMSHYSLGRIGISTGRYNRGVRSRGLSSESRWIFSTLIETVGATINRVKVKAGEPIIIKPNTEFHFANEHGCHFAAVLIKPEDIFGYIEAQQPGVMDGALFRETLSVQTLDSVNAAARLRDFQTLLTGLDTHGPTIPPETTEFYQRNLMELVAAPILAAVQYRSAHLADQDTLVRNIQRYLTAAGPLPIHVSELCERFHVHPRALFRAFHDVMGMPPISYLRKKRLNDVHTELLRAACGVTVRDIAIRHGFLDHSRFSAAYHRMFGELPRETLKRSIRAIAIGAFLTFSFVSNPLILEYDDDDFFVLPQLIICEPIHHRPYD